MRHLPFFDLPSIAALMNMWRGLRPVRIIGQSPLEKSPWAVLAPLAFQGKREMTRTGRLGAGQVIAFAFREAEESYVHTACHHR